MDNHNSGHRERVREKIVKQGFKDMQDYEVLEFLLFAFIPRKDTKVIAKQLLAECGSLRAVLMSSPQVLEQIPNMTKNASLFLSSLTEVYKRFNLNEFGQKPRLANLLEIKSYLNTLFEGMEEEVIYLIALDSKGYLKEQILLSQGGIDECRLSVKKLVVSCVNLNCQYVYIAHNHPVGKAHPSVQDIDFTKWLKDALEIMEITLVDHIIVGSRDIFSFKQNNLI